MTLKELQAKIEKDNPRPLRLEKTRKVRKESLHDFLVKFFTLWVSEKATIYVDTKEVQTPVKGYHGAPRRSLGDIFMICKYYYPEITLKEVVYELFVGLLEHFEGKGYRTSYCHSINKRVWYYDSEKPGNQYDKTTNDEYGKPYRYYLEAANRKSRAAVCPDCGYAKADCECDV